MNIETAKLELMNLLLQTEDENLLLKIKKVFEEESKDWWDELSTEEQDEIILGNEQVERDEVKSHKEVMKRFEKWH